MFETKLRKKKHTLVSWGRRVPLFCCIWQKVKVWKSLFPLNPLESTTVIGDNLLITNHFSPETTTSKNTRTLTPSSGHLPVKPNKRRGKKRKNLSYPQVQVLAGGGQALVLDPRRGRSDKWSCLKNYFQTYCSIAVVMLGKEERERTSRGLLHDHTLWSWTGTLVGCESRCPCTWWPLWF